MLALAPRTQTAPEHRDDDTKQHPNTAGSRYLQRIAEGMDPNSALIMARNEGERKAKRILNERPDTLNRGYKAANYDQFVADVGGMLVERILSAPNDDARKLITISSCVGRVDRQYNKATRYWVCLYFVRLNYVLAPHNGDSTPIVVPFDSDWVRVTKKQYKLARKHATHQLEGHPWIETYEYRTTPRRLTESDHDESTGYHKGDNRVWYAINTLSDAERTALHLYGMGVRSPIIGQAVFGKRKGAAAAARILVARTLAKLASTLGQLDSNPNIARYRDCSEAVRAYYGGTRFADRPERAPNEPKKLDPNDRRTTRSDWTRESTRRRLRANIGKAATI